VTVKEPRHGYEEWPDSRPQAPLCGAIPDNVFLISLELGLSPNDEVRQLDHFMDAKEWSALTGQKMKYEAEDYHISRFVTDMLRHAKCYWKFPMNAMGYSPYMDVLNAVIGSQANKTRIAKRRVGVSQCNFPGFLRVTSRDLLFWQNDNVGVRTQLLDPLEDPRHRRAHHQDNQSFAHGVHHQAV